MRKDSEVRSRTRVPCRSCGQDSAPSDLPQAPISRRMRPSLRAQRLRECVFCLSSRLFFPAIQKCFHVGVGRHNLECLINPAINQGGEVTMGVAELPSERCPWPVSMQADGWSSRRGDGHRVQERRLLGKRFSEQKPGCQDGLVGWLFHSIHRYFLSNSCVPGTGPGPKETYTGET